MNRYIGKLLPGLFLFPAIMSWACDSSADQPQGVINAQISQPEPPPSPNVKTESKAEKPKAASVAGTYEYNTYEGRKEGYVNTLRIEQTNNKLKVSISGSYIYQANGAETVKDAEVGGEGELKGRTANLELTGEDGTGCRAKINFAEGQATLKVADACAFNVMLDGVYKKAGKK